MNQWIDIGSQFRAQLRERLGNHVSSPLTGKIQDFRATVAGGSYRVRDGSHAFAFCRGGNATRSTHAAERQNVRPPDAATDGDHRVHRDPRDTGTILVRGLYGRGGPASVTGARVCAARGYHVVLQSVRGTFGSGGEFTPGRHEADDGADTVTWLRTQPWFTGRFATMGKFLPRLYAVGAAGGPAARTGHRHHQRRPHDMSATAWATGAFALNDFLGWSDLVARQEDGRIKPFVVGLLGHWRVNPAMRALPLGEAGRRLLRDGAPWYEDGSDTRIRRTSTGVRCDRPPRWIGFRSRCC
jgi:hypothetical protein